MSTEKKYDVIVIGGGPSGMMSAGRAGSRGRKTLLLEKNYGLGKKLELTGGGRCNILNAEEDEKRLLDKYGKDRKFLFSTFSQHGMKDSFCFFEKHGLPLVVESRKRAFPKSQKAGDVVRLMKKFIKENNVQTKTEVTVDGFKVDSSNRIIAVLSDVGEFKAENYILATGGKAFPETGSTGEGLLWLKDLGHKVHRSEPGLVPLVVKEKWVKDLSGVTLSFVKITFGKRSILNNERTFSKKGKILFTHFGLSGPLILNSSKKVKEFLKRGPLKTEIDMYPDTDIGSVRKNVLKFFEKNKNKTLKNVMKECSPKGMSETILKVSFPDLGNKKVNEITKEEREHLADIMKAMPLTVIGTMDFDRSIVSEGGVDLREVDTKTMKSKLCPNLFLTGDILNLERPSGGFSLQWCWTSGWVAGSNA